MLTFPLFIALSNRLNDCNNYIVSEASTKELTMRVTEA